MAPADGSNDIIADLMTKHGLDLLRFEAGQRRKVRGLLAELEGDLVAQLARIDPAGAVRSGARAARLEKLLDQVRDTIRVSYRGASSTIAGELRELADIEAGFAARAINRGIGIELATSTLTRAQAGALVGEVLIQGAPVAEWWSRQAGDTLQRFTDQMRLGMAQGDTSAQLIQRIRGGTRNGEPVAGFMEISKRNADSLVRSATQAVAERAKQSTYRANADILAALVWTSTLDSRTTVVCAVRDGLRYTVEDQEPIGHNVPWDAGPGNLHFGCRSSSRPETKSFRELGIDVDELPAATRASMDGQVAADTSFEDWLGKRSTAQQDEALGAGRAALWRDGKIGFRDLLDQNGRELTLAELRARV
jgi:SPP1 gp7 family putative phage head morphogenesis protein